MQVADGRTRLQEAIGAVGLDDAGGDLQQRRLAGAVAADKADAVAGLDLQVERRSKAACHRRTSNDIIEFQNGWRHGQAPERS